MNKHGRFFFFNDTPTTETYTLSLHDALPISLCRIKRVPEARLCTRSCSWDSSLTTRGGSPVRELRPPGSRSGAHTSELPSRAKLVGRALIEKRESPQQERNSKPHWPRVMRNA